MKAIIKVEGHEVKVNAYGHCQFSNWREEALQGDIWEKIVAITENTDGVAEIAKKHVDFRTFSTPAGMMADGAWVELRECRKIDAENLNEAQEMCEDGFAMEYCGGFYEVMADAGDVFWAKKTWGEFTGEDERNAFTEEFYEDWKSRKITPSPDYDSPTPWGCPWEYLPTNETVCEPSELLDRYIDEITDGERLGEEEEED